MKKRLLIWLIISVFVATVAAYNYLHLSGTEDIRAIHIVTLLVCGAGIGIFILSFMGLFFWKKD